MSLFESTVQDGDVDRAGLVHFVHPVIDEFGDGFVVYASSCRQVRLSAPLQLFLADARQFGLRPVLVTHSDTTVSVFTSYAMREYGGVWAGQQADGATFNALSGRRIDSFPQLWDGSGDGEEQIHPGFREPQESGRVRTLTFDLTVFRPPAASLQVGGVAEAIVAGLDGGPLECWGTSEPLLHAWNLGEVTEVVRSQMPESEPVLAANRSGAFTLTRVMRTRTGLLEQVRGGVPVTDDGLGFRGLLNVASRALDLVADSFPVTLGFVCLADYDAADGGLGQGMRTRAPESPLAVLIGKRALRDLGVGVRDLRDRFDVQLLGADGGNGMLLRLSGDEGLWAQLLRFGNEVGLDRIGRAMGIDGTEVARDAH